MSSTQFDDDDWELLIADIEQHNVVPIVGPGLLIKGADSSTTFHDYLVSLVSGSFEPPSLQPIL